MQTHPDLCQAIVMFGFDEEVRMRAFHLASEVDLHLSVVTFFEVANAQHWNRIVRTTGCDRNLTRCRRSRRHSYGADLFADCIGNRYYCEPGWYGATKEHLSAFSVSREICVRRRDQHEFGQRCHCGKCPGAVGNLNGSQQRDFAS